MLINECFLFNIQYRNRYNSLKHFVIGCSVRNILLVALAKTGYFVPAGRFVNEFNAHRIFTESVPKEHNPHFKSVYRRIVPNGTELRFAKNIYML